MNEKAPGENTVVSASPSDILFYFFTFFEFLFEDILKNLSITAAKTLPKPESEQNLTKSKNLFCISPI